MRDWSVKTTSFHSGAHILFQAHHWRRRRLWFHVKGRPSNGRIVDRPLCCKRCRMVSIALFPLIDKKIHRMGFVQTLCRDNVFSEEPTINRGTSCKPSGTGCMWKGCTYGVMSRVEPRGVLTIVMSKIRTSETKVTVELDQHLDSPSSLNTVRKHLHKQNIYDTAAITKPDVNSKRLLQ
ncbi:hypothetical protein TNCV_2217731 [Trichonephila clavipes]|nr:hypothetical protein TNCV_2217731 [Trichonephila clavipes]